MRKISMKRKSKTVENTADSPKPENNGHQAEDEQDSSSSQEIDNSRKNSRKSKSVGHQENDTEKSPKKKSKKGRKSKSLNVNESNGTEPEDDQFEVEQILDQKTTKGEKKYLIRWKGYGPESDTWEPAATINCPDLVAEFEEANSPKKSKKRASTSNSKSSKKSKTDESTSDEAGEYEVDRIVEVHFKKNGKREFLVHWKGYSANENTWEPEENMNCPDLINKFMEKVNKARDVDTRELRIDRKPTNYFTLSMQQAGRRLSKRTLGKQRAQYKESD